MEKDAASHGRSATRNVYPDIHWSQRTRASRARDIDLETHIQDILAVLECEDLRDVILVGHSYGGMVATGVADRARDKIRHLVYLDAFAPESVSL